MHGSNLPAAGWFPDPERADQLRYWDGQAWTEHRHPALAPSNAQPVFTAAQEAVPKPPWQPAAPGTNIGSGTQGPSSPDRPWFKKKRFVIPGAVAALIIYGAATSDSDEPTTAATSQPGAPAGSAAKDSAAANPKSSARQGHTQGEAAASPRRGDI
jgi:hypothetical protein